MQLKQLRRLKTPVLTTVIVISFILGAILIRADKQAGVAVESLYSQKLFDTEGFGIYARNEKNEWTIIYQLKDSAPRLYKYNELPEEFIKRLLEIEDKRFMEHDGVDFVRIIGAAWQDIRRRELAQGGSTLTQQFARGVTGLSREKSFLRKLTEARIAQMIEKRELVAAGGDKLQAKKNIIAKYCSYIDLGFRHGKKVHGFPEAAQAYFGKSIHQLTLGEQALLIGMLKGITAYGPHTEPEKAAERREVIINEWLTAGLVPEVKRNAKTIKTSVQVAETAKNEKVKVVGNNGSSESFLVDQVTKELEYIGRSGSNAKIYTTYSLGIQSALNALANQMPGIQNRYPGIEVGGVVLNWKTGAVLGMIGGSSYGEGYNRAFNKQAERQLGSTFKPFVYAAALASGYTPQNEVRDEPLENSEWTPENADGKFRGTMTLADALVFSRNPPAAVTAQAIGLHTVAEFAANAGLPGQPEVLTIALGTGGARVVELASAYTAFVNRGKRVTPFTIESIKNGNDYTHAVEERDSMSSEVAAQIIAILIRAAKEGTGSFLYNEFGMRCVLASKTGSSRDGWVVIMTPGGLLACVYVGYDEPAKYNTGNLFGGSTAGRIVGDFLRRLQGKTKYQEYFAGNFGVPALPTPTPTATPTPTPEPEAEPDQAPMETSMPSPEPTRKLRPRPTLELIEEGKPTPAPTAKSNPSPTPAPGFIPSLRDLITPKTRPRVVGTPKPE